MVEGRRTPLQRQLAEGRAVVRATPLDALRLAREMFLAGERVDLTQLAERLDVNRVTVHRWVGSRDQLLVEVLWSLAREVLDRADQRARSQTPGAERVVQTVVGFLETVTEHPAMRRFLSDEGDLALRLLTRQDRGFQQRLIGAVEELLAEEQDAGRLEPPPGVERHEVAYVVVRVIESYSYLDLITGETPDAARAEPILRLLLRP